MGMGSLVRRAVRVEFVSYLAMVTLSFNGAPNPFGSRKMAMYTALVADARSDSQVLPCVDGFSLLLADGLPREGVRTAGRSSSLRRSDCYLCEGVRQVERSSLADKMLASRQDGCCTHQTHTFCFFHNQMDSQWCVSTS